MDKSYMLKSYLIDLEAALRMAGFWEKEAPAAEMLQSTQPFCIDTLEFNQWLQWVFIPRLYDLLDKGKPLPANCGVAPMMLEWGKKKAIGVDDLFMILEKIDLLLTQASSSEP